MSRVGNETPEETARREAAGVDDDTAKMAEWLFQYCKRTGITDKHPGASNELFHAFDNKVWLDT